MQHTDWHGGALRPAHLMEDEMAELTPETLREACLVFEPTPHVAWEAYEILCRIGSAHADQWKKREAEARWLLQNEPPDDLGMYTQVKRREWCDRRYAWLQTRPSDGG